MRMILLATIASLGAATPALPQAAIKMPIAPGLWTSTFKKIPCSNASYGYVFDGKRWGSFYFYGPNGNLGPNAELKPITATSAGAGGFTRIASRNSTRIIRLEDGMEKIIEVKVDAITDAGKKIHDVVIKAGDIIVVPESFF